MQIRDIFGFVQCHIKSAASFRHLHLYFGVQRELRGIAALNVLTQQKIKIMTENIFVQKLLPVSTLQPLVLSVLPHHESDPFLPTVF